VYLFLLAFKSDKPSRLSVRKLLDDRFLTSAHKNAPVRADSDPVHDNRLNLLR
jgi:hypothetical protein